MNTQQNKHYTNEYGMELNEYLQHTFNHESLKGWYTMQVLKYLVRAGKKDGESYHKDVKKAVDYAMELATLISKNEHIKVSKIDVMLTIQSMANDFKHWKG